MNTAKTQKRRIARADKKGPIPVVIDEEYRKPLFRALPSKSQKTYARLVNLYVSEGLKRDGFI